MMTVVACGLAACASQRDKALSLQLIARRAPSLAAWEGGEDRLRSATKRMGIILPHGADARGVPIRFAEDGAKPGEHFAFFDDQTPGKRIKIGAAVPITKDGYFLTAKHCLAKGSPAVFVHDRANKKLIKSMGFVVWESGDADLALLRTTHRIAKPFTLADGSSIKEGEGVGSAGWSGLAKAGIFDGMAAGKICSVSRHGERRSGKEVWWEFVHDSPIQPGDSGGLLIDSRGRLVGIHSGGRLGAISICEPKPGDPPLSGFQAISNLPDRQWIMRRIDADRAVR